MRDEAELLADLEAFIDDAVRITMPSEHIGDNLTSKINVLERVVELMRLRSGTMENRLRMDELLGGGLAASRGRWCSSTARGRAGGPRAERMAFAGR